MPPVKRSNNPLATLLDERVRRYNQPSFISADPICIPHAYTLQQDIEIAGLFAAILAWGNRTTIIAKSREILHRMDNAPTISAKTINRPTYKSCSDLNTEHLTIPIYCISYIFCNTIISNTRVWKLPFYPSRVPTPKSAIRPKKDSRIFTGIFFHWKMPLTEPENT